MEKVDYFFFGILLLCALVVIRALIIRRDTRNVWIDFAVRRELKFYDPWDTGKRQGAKTYVEARLPNILVEIISTFVMPFVIGTNNGFPFELSTKTKGSGEYIKSYSFMKLKLSDLPMSIHVYQKKNAHKRQKIFSYDNISTGDTDFDRIFMVSGNDPKLALSYLTVRRRAALKRYWMEIPGLQLRQGALYLEKRGLLKKMDELELFFRKMGELAIELR